MQANTNQARRKKNAIRGAVSSTVMQFAVAAVLFWLRESAGEFVSRLLLLAAVIQIAAVPLVWLALRERLKEIEGGEEEDASQY